MYSEVTPLHDEVFMNLVQRTKQRFALLRDTLRAANNVDALTGLLLAEQAFDEIVGDLTPNPADKLTLADAARWTGYTKNYLTSLVRAGQLKNYGRKRNPRFVRAELPRKGQAMPHG